MHLIYKRFGTILGFVLLLVILLVNALVTERQLAVMISQQSAVQHTQQVLIAIDQTQTLIESAVTGQRSYLYTRDPKYLTPYDEAIAQLGPQLQLLQNLTARNAIERAHVAYLRILVQAKLDQLARVILLYQSGYPAAARQEVLSDRSRLLMMRITNLIGLIQLQETSLASSRYAVAHHSIVGTYIALGVATLIAILGLCLVAYYIFKTMALRDVYARHLEEREAWFRSTLTSLGDAVVATDERGYVTFLNPMAEDLMGISLIQARGKPIAEVFTICNEATGKAVENPVSKILGRSSVENKDHSSGENQEPGFSDIPEPGCSDLKENGFKDIPEPGFPRGVARHAVLKRADGVLIPIEDSAAPIRSAHGRLVGVVMVFRDSTQERKSQEVLRKTEKLAAAARLAATVAHEINNPLEAIGNLIYIAKTTSDVPSSAVGHLALAEAELTRVSHITRQTLGFYRESKMPDEVDLPTLVESVLDIYSNKFRTKNISVERDFQACPPIYGLSGELNQAIANLVSNAADAVPNGGKIRVRIDCGDAAVGKEDNAVGKIVRIIIADNGPGIALEHRDHIFEPFFTTKKDVGTGLGLWVTREIVERHSGEVDVHCVTAEETEATGATGATFTVTLPIHPEIDDAGAL